VNDKKDTSALSPETEAQPILNKIWAQYREMKRQQNEKCMRDPSAYVPTTWQFLTRGLGVAAGVGLYRWIGGKK